jgi:hypothetical protein
LMRSPTWVITWPTRQSATSCGDTASSRPQKKPKHDLERVHRVSHGSFGRDRFLHRRSAHLGAGDLLCVVLHSPGESAGQPGRNYATPGKAWMEQMARNATAESWVTWSAGAMRSTIGTRSSAPRFGRHWRRVESERTIIGEPHLKLCVREIGNEAVNSYPYQQRHAVRTS